MALSTAIFVGKSQEWIPEIVERAKQLKTNAGEEREGEVGRLNCSQSSGRHCSGLCSFLLKAPSLHLGDQPGADLGPLISPEAKQRVCDLVQTGVDEGAKVRRLHAHQLTL